MSSVEPVVVQTRDGLRLEGELAVPDNVQGAVVLSHPHPMHGGNMRSIVVGALFAGLPKHNIACLRFNFRGIGNSEGAFEDGVGERLDIVAALDLVFPIVEGVPLVLVGWSFGADTSLTVGDPRISGWCAIAPPLRPRALEAAVAASDERPKLLLVPQNDQFRNPNSARQAISSWNATRVSEVPGADHFMVGRTDRVVNECAAFINDLAGAQSN